MHLLLTFVLGSMMAFFIGQYWVQVTQIDTPDEWAVSRGQEDVFRAFRYAAEVFMRQPVPAATATPRSVTWSTLRRTGGAVPAAAESMVPPGWRLVYDAQRWAICTPVPSVVANSFQGRIALQTSTGIPVRHYATSGGTAVVDAATQTQAFTVIDQPESVEAYLKNPAAELQAYVNLCRTP